MSWGPTGGQQTIKVTADVDLVNLGAQLLPLAAADTDKLVLLCLHIVKSTSIQMTSPHCYACMYGYVNSVTLARSCEQCIQPNAQNAV